MKKIIIGIYNPFEYDIKYLNKFIKPNIELKIIKKSFNLENIHLVKGCDIISTFVNDICDVKILEKLNEYNIKCILNRRAGYNNIDLKKAAELNIKVYRVPVYSPASVAEFAIGLALSLIRRIPSAYNRTRQNNFSLEGIDSYTIKGKTVGVIGTGAIGISFIKIIKGFGSKIIAYDKYPNESKAKKYGFEYVSLDEVFKNSDIISLHCPSTPETKYLINEKNILKMKDNVIIINTSRGDLINTPDLLKYLKNNKIKGVGLDVYEKERGIFFYDLEEKFINDPILFELLKTPMVLLTSHQAYFTAESLNEISIQTFKNLENYFYNKENPNNQIAIKEEVYFDIKTKKVING